MTMYGPESRITMNQLRQWQRLLTGRVVRAWVEDYESADDAEADDANVYVVIVDEVRVTSGIADDTVPWFTIIGRNWAGDEFRFDSDLFRWETADA